MATRFLGPTGSRRRRRFILFAPLVAIAALVMAMAASGGPIGTASGFEDDDANLIVNSTFDWNGFSPVTWSPHPATTPTRTAEKTVSGWKFLGVEDWQNTTSDSGFAGGTKQDDDCASVITAKAPNKDDLKRIYLSTKTVGGHVYLNLAWDRIPQNTTSASAHIGFEFNQGTTACPAGSDGLVRRTAGDMLIVYDFEGGGNPVLTLRRWVTSGACEVGSDSPPCWGPATNLTAGGFAEGAVNTGGSVLDQLAPPALSSATGGSVNETLGPSEFGEAGIDLTAAGVFNSTTCAGFGKVYAVSRSSGSSAQAQMKDLVGPANFSLNNCGTVTIIKHTNPGGIDQDFGFTSTLAGTQMTCTADTSPASFTLNDAGTDTETCTNVPIGSYIATEGADPAGFDFNDVTCEVTGSGTGVQDGTIEKQVNIGINAGGDTVTCTYVNDQVLGAIQVTKTRKHAADGSGNHPHAGVSFTVNGVTKQTDANGVACFDGLAFATYTVHETVPTGYAGEGDKSVTVDNSATCAATPFGGETVTFHNTPLTNITASVDSQVDGGTASTITCVDSDGNTVASGATGANGDGSATGSNLEPDTYTCTLVVDP
jgi:Prealbumin-like fold domain